MGGHSVLEGDFVAASSIPGGVAGVHQVPAIQSSDELLVVLDYTADLSVRTVRTGEFSIVGADQVTNAGGTNTTGRFLLIAWRRRP